MEINKEKKDGKTVINLSGQIDSTAATEFESTLVEIIDSGTHVMILNFADVKFVSSAGLRVLLLAGKKVKPHDGKVILCNLATDVQEVFDISGFSSLFIICADVEAALEKA
jgi:anti-anti-sigma factor